VQKIAPKEQQERQAGHEGARSKPGRMQFDVDADKANHQQQHRKRGRRQRFDQFERPIRLRHPRIAVEPVKLLELVETINDVTRDVELQRAVGWQSKRLAGRFDPRSLSPIVWFSLFGRFLGRKIADLARLCILVSKKFHAVVDHCSQQRPAMIDVVR
jgi:hypothetical protein